MSEPKAPKGPVNPRTRANIYALAALYLAYLFYQIAKPYLTRDPYGPTTNQFLLGTVVLGGGAVALAFLAWKMYKAPLPEEPAEEEPGEAVEEEQPEAPALPEDGEGEED